MFTEFEDYDLEEFEPACSDSSDFPSVAHATQYNTVSFTDVLPKTSPSFDEDNDLDTPAFVPRPSHSRKRKEGHIPRPPNAFMLFRQNFVHQRHVPGSIETSHTSLSKIVGAFVFPS